MTADSDGFFIDITGETCPMTFVKAKLMVERMPVGAVGTIRLTGAEPLENVPRTLAEQGHPTVSLAPESDDRDGADAVWRLSVRRGP